MGHSVISFENRTALLNDVHIMLVVGLLRTTASGRLPAVTEVLDAWRNSLVHAGPGTIQLDIELARRTGVLEPLKEAVDALVVELGGRSTGLLPSFAQQVCEGMDVSFSREVPLEGLLEAAKQFQVVLGDGQSGMPQ